LGLLVSVSALLELLFGPVWGGVSDRTGRKPILLLGVFGYALSSLLFGLSTEVWMLFASRALSGVLSSAVSATALAYISDCTSAEERGWGMGMLGAARGLVLILGPAAGGWLGEQSLALPFFVAAGMSLVALALGAALLPESLPCRGAAARGHSSKTVQFRTLWQALFGPVGLLLFMLFMVSFG
jgi:DHA1 family multidrug resistance protein-like MFS transporter